MKAMVLSAPGELALGEVPAPTPGPGRALIRVTNMGVCGTDLKIYNGAIPVDYPLIMGHEIIGEVMENGGNVGIRSGDMVLVDPQLFCGECFHCRIGQTHLCPNGQLIGRDADGGFAEYVIAPASHVFRLPASIDRRTAPLIQVLTTCVHAQRFAEGISGRSVVVLGLGVTGQLHVQLAKARGANPVIGVTRSSAKRELARKLGADVTIPAGEGAIAKVLEATGDRGADLIVETTGVVASVADAIEMARPGGRLLLFGIITAKEGALPFYQLYFKELSVANARVAKSEDFQASIDLVQRGIVRLEPLVSDVLPLEELKTAMTMLASGAGQRMKIILENS
jgi:2-desacetyl-2-hydroxyethyl bacteriochlorophyllide A dehydrogenase